MTWRACLQTFSHVCIARSDSGKHWPLNPEPWNPSNPTNKETTNCDILEGKLTLQQPNKENKPSDHRMQEVVSRKEHANFQQAKTDRAPLPPRAVQWRGPRNPNHQCDPARPSEPQTNHLAGGGGGFSKTHNLRCSVSKALGSRGFAP